MLLYVCVCMCVCVGGGGGGGGGLPRSATGWSAVCDCPVSFPSSCLFYFKFSHFCISFNSKTS